MYNKHIQRVDSERQREDGRLNKKIGSREQHGDAFPEGFFFFFLLFFSFFLSYVSQTEYWRTEQPGNANGHTHT